jgi:hypothetical protein
MEKELNRARIQIQIKCTIYNTVYVNCAKKTLKGNFAASQGGLFQLCPLRSDDSQDSQTGGWTSLEEAKGTEN